MQKLAWLAVLTLSAVFAAAEAGADVITIEPVRDTMLVEDPGQDLSNGGGQHSFAGLTAQSVGFSIRRMLLKFDVAGNLPANAVINSASLQLYVTRAAGGSSVSTSLHRVTSDWGEAASVGFRGEGAGASALTNDVTWRHTFFPGTFWNTPGGDFVATASAAQTFNTSGPASFSSPQLAADVQSMADNAGADFGWVVIGPEAGPRNARRFGSRENTNSLFRPQLTIDFSIAAPVDGGNTWTLLALLVGLTGVGTLFLRRKTG